MTFARIILEYNIINEACSHYMVTLLQRVQSDNTQLVPQRHQKQPQ